MEENLANMKTLDYNLPSASTNYSTEIFLTKDTNDIFVSQNGQSYLISYVA